MRAMARFLASLTALVAVLLMKESAHRPLPGSFPKPDADRPPREPVDAIIITQVTTPDFDPLTDRDVKRRLAERVVAI